MRKLVIATLVALFAASAVAQAEGRRGGQGMKQQQQQHAAALSGSQSGSGNFIDLSDRSDNKVEGDDYPAAQAWAAPLVATEDTCMGSSSAGGQAASFGVSIATTWRDGDCVRRKDARLLHNMGLHGPAAALMCQKEDVRRAFADAGVACVNPSVQAERAVPKPVAAPVSHHKPADTDDNDPFAFQDGYGG